MIDENQNSVEDADEITFHKKSFITGVLTGVFGGSITLSIGVYFFPSLAGLLAVFAGSVCEPVKVELGHYKEAIACCEARLDEFEFKLCRSKFEGE